MTVVSENKSDITLPCGRSCCSDKRPGGVSAWTTVDCAGGEGETSQARRRVVALYRSSSLSHSMSVPVLEKNLYQIQGTFLYTIIITRGSNDYNHLDYFYMCKELEGTLYVCIFLTE